MALYHLMIKPKLSLDTIIAGGTFVHCVIFLQLISKLARNIRAYLHRARKSILWTLDIVQQWVKHQFNRSSYTSEWFNSIQIKCCLKNGCNYLIGISFSPKKKHTWTWLEGKGKIATQTFSHRIWGQGKVKSSTQRQYLFFSLDVASD